MVQGDQVMQVTPGAAAVVAAARGSARFLVRQRCRQPVLLGRVVGQEDAAPTAGMAASRAGVPLGSLRWVPKSELSIHALWLHPGGPAAMAASVATVGWPESAVVERTKPSISPEEI